MEEPLRRQGPRYRTTDPAEAVRLLEQAVPGLVRHRRPVPAAHDWSVIEDGLGTRLPADWKLLTELYPPFLLGDYFHVIATRPGDERFWLEGLREQIDIAREVWEIEYELAPPDVPAAGALIPWASSYEGDTFAWRITGTDPDRWPVMVGPHEYPWWEYTGGAVQFTADLITERLERWSLHSVRHDVFVYNR